MKTWAEMPMLEYVVELAEHHLHSYREHERRGLLSLDTWEWIHAVAISAAEELADI